MEQIYEQIKKFDYKYLNKENKTMNFKGKRTS